MELCGASSSLGSHWFLVHRKMFGHMVAALSKVWLFHQDTTFFLSLLTRELLGKTDDASPIWTTTVK